MTANVGEVRVGSDAPVVVQSMTNTDTADALATAQQVEALARAGSELVRITVNNDEGRPHMPDAAILREQICVGGCHPLSLKLWGL